MKGINDYLQESEAPYCMVDGHTISAYRPCDLLVAQSGASYVVRTATDEGDDVRVQLPNGEVRASKAERGMRLPLKGDGD